MKRILLLLISIVAVVSCYDDGPIWDELQDHENRIVALETLCAQMNTNITSLQTIVTALQSNDYVTAVAPIKEGDKVIGYTITFNKAGSVTIYNGADGADGKDGAAAKAPVIGVRQDTDDAYYWTIDGEWLLDEKGNKVKASASDGEAGADGQTPQLDLKEGYWWVSYDGKEWTKLGVASGSSNLVDVRLEGSFIYLTLDNETVLKIPMSIGVPDMTVESGYERLIFRGKANPVSPDFVVGAFVSSEMDELKGMIPLGVEESNGYAYDFGEDGSFAFGAELYDDGREGMEFYYYTFVYANGVFSFSELKTIRFEANQAELAYGITNITETSVTFKGKVTLKRPADVVVYVSDKYDIDDTKDLQYSKPDSDGNFELTVTGLEAGTSYYLRIGVNFGGELAVDCQACDYVGFTTKSPYERTFDLDASQATDLSSAETANCYVVSSAGLYKFKAVKGNDESLTLTNAVSASILWESYGAPEEIKHLDLIAGVEYENGYVVIKTAETFKPGNAVVAVKNADGDILWSWHIWMTEGVFVPSDIVYQYVGENHYLWDNDNSVFTDEVTGVMMDRNLGATVSASQGLGEENFIKSVGLLYQWGRKDPFLGYGGGYGIAPSTIDWPADGESRSCGTIDFAIEHPTTFIRSENSYLDDPGNTWMSQPDNDLWGNVKTIYDPCPAGWRVPDGEEIWGDSGFWSDGVKVGIFDSVWRFTSGQYLLQYPILGIIVPDVGYDGYNVDGVGHKAAYWSADNLYTLDIYDYYIELRSIPTAAGASVRCMKTKTVSSCSL